MVKWKRSERVSAIVEKLLSSPGEMYTLGDFSDYFNSARSTISEDISIVRDVLKEIGRGQVVTIAGPSGGVKYVPGISDWRRDEILKSLVEKLSNPERILPGGYLYMTDCIYDPRISNNLGEIFANHFYKDGPDAVVTVETKGIPLAMATAFFLNVPVIAARRDHIITEGTSVSINYVSGSSRTIQTMSLARRSLKEVKKVLIIDDFMRAGGTINGLMELMQEFQVDVVGVGVLLSTNQPEKKLVKDYFSLMGLEKIDIRKQEISLSVSKF